MNQSKEILTLDITNEVCPMIFVKTKIFLDKCPVNVEKKILLKGKDNLESLSKTLIEQNHKIKIEKQNDPCFRIIVKASKV